MFQHLDELAEHEHAVTAFHGLRNELSERRQLAARVVSPLGFLELHQPRVAGHLAQTRERREDLNLRLGDALLLHLAEHALPDLAKDLGVELLLLFSERNDDLLLDLLRQLGRHLFLGAPQHKRVDRSP